MTKKKAVKALIEKFLNHHYYFSTVWPYLTPSIKNNILNIIAEGKGVIPYEIIIDMNSSFLKPDKKFWEKTEFFSELKLSAVDNGSYENSKYLYHNLTMRNLGDLNDLSLVITKIVKLDENNQYGNAMTKPLPTGCIKDNNDLSWETFNFLLETVSFNDTIGHLYVVDIEFDVKNATKKEFGYNEICPPIIEKQKTIDPCERSVFQLLEQFVSGEKGPKSYRTSAKAHAKLFKKYFLSMYLEDLLFCIKRAGWKVTKIHSHLTFEQSRFKQNFILINQKSRQLSKNNVEKEFYKLMNNSNFGYDCRNNLDNCKFVPIFDQFREVTYVN